MKPLSRLKPVYFLALLSALGASQASATVSYQILNGGLESFNVSIDGTFYGGALAGGILINQTGAGDPTSIANTPSSYITVCTDIQGTLYLGQSYSYNAPVNFSPSLVGVAPKWGSDNTGANISDATSAAEAIQNAAALFYTHNSVLTTGTVTQKAALQLAVWDALYNTSASGVINGTRFTFGGGDASAVSLANTWLSGLNTPLGSYSGQLFVPNPLNQGNADGEPPQELFYLPSLLPPTALTAIPEATTMIAAVLLLLPFGASALRVLRKQPLVG